MEELIPIENLPVTPEKVRAKILQLQAIFAKMPGRLIGDSPEYLEHCPLKHTFTEGIYTREIFLPKAYYFITKTHKVEHPFFIISGDVSILTERGIERLKGPCHGITRPGTKRFIYTNEDTVWITVHPNPDNETSPEKLVERLTIHEDVDFNLLDGGEG